MEDFCCTLIRGTIYLRKASNISPNPNGLLPVGNVTVFSVSHELTEVEQTNYQSLGGTSCKLTYINSANLNMTIGCIKARNLALAVQGTGAYQNITGAAVVNEVHRVNVEGELVAFNRVPNPAVAIVVTDVAGTITYVAGVDYKVVPAGIEILDGTTMVLGANIHVDYTYGANTVIDALATSQEEYEVVLSGQNVGEGGEAVPVKFEAFKVKWNPAEELSLIGDEFMTIEVVGEILRDDTKVSGSKFYKMEYGI